jgi:hypothetical protein
MHSFRYIFALPVIAGWIAVCPAADVGEKVEYIGGTIEKLANGSDGSIQTSRPTHLLFVSKGRSIEVPYDQVNLLEYGQKVNRRVGMAVVVSPLFLMSKARKHFLTIGFTDADGQQQAMVFRVGKEGVRSLLASLEARTGVKVTFQDEEARKAGKG